MWEFWGLPDATGEALVKVGNIVLSGVASSHSAQLTGLLLCSLCSLWLVHSREWPAVGAVRCSVYGRPNSCTCC